MTEKDLLIQELRCENKRLKEENERMRIQAAQDMSQLVYYRRQIDFLMEVAKNENEN